MSAHAGGALPFLSALLFRPPPHRPVLIDMNKVYRQSNVENLEQAFSVAEHELGVTRLLDPEGTLSLHRGRGGAAALPPGCSRGLPERALGALTSPSPAADVDVPQPDEKSIITYVSSLYDAMPRVPDVQDGVKANVRGGWRGWEDWGGGGVAGS